MPVKASTPKSKGSVGKYTKKKIKKNAKKSK